jgi:hypothetical protein
MTKRGLPVDKQGQAACHFAKPGLVLVRFLDAVIDVDAHLGE